MLVTASTACDSATWVCGLLTALLVVDQRPGEQLAHRNSVVCAEPPPERNNRKHAVPTNPGAGSGFASQPVPGFSLQPGLQPLVGSTHALGHLGESEPQLARLDHACVASRAAAFFETPSPAACGASGVVPECAVAQPQGVVDRARCTGARTCIGFKTQKSKCATGSSGDGAGSIQAASGRLVDRIESREFGRVQQKLTNALGGLERLRNQPLPASSTFFIRVLTWVYGYLVFLKLDALGPITAAVVGWLVFLIFLMAERIGTYLERPFVDARFALPMDRFCALISSDLLGSSDPLAQVPASRGPWLR